MGAGLEGERCVVIGAGPAGLTAAYELSGLGVPAIVCEQSQALGGLSQTATHRGYRFDIGGHRFFTKASMIQDLWMEILGTDFLVRPRLSRIFYNDHFFDYPLRPLSALAGLGPSEAVRIMFSYLVAQIAPFREEENFEQWVCNRFGRRLYEIFFKTYTEKVWGIPCTEIRADWAAQRIKNLDLVTALRNALVGEWGRGGKVVASLIEEFHYPRFGPGMMWEAVAERLTSRGCPILQGEGVAKLHWRDDRVLSVTLRDARGVEREEAGAHFISSMPVRDLVQSLDPPPPPEVIDAAKRLRYRDFLTVGLIVDRADLFPDNWIYVHSPKVRVGRVQNFKNWSEEMVPDPTKSSLGLEYFVQEDDELWRAADDELIAMASQECVELDLVREQEVLEGVVIRAPKAYPVYDQAYADAIETIRGWLEGLTNLQLIGRNGQHRYNNQDHSMVTGIYAARNVAGAHYDVWDVNIDDEYHEEARESGASGERAVPRSLEVDRAERALRDAFARFDAVALGDAVGILAGLVWFLATAVPLLRAGGDVSPVSAAYFLLGLELSWSGALQGALAVGCFGFLAGALLARMINLVVGWHERTLVARLAAMRALGAPDGGGP